MNKKTDLEIRDFLKKLFSLLTPKEFEILVFRNGLSYGIPKTLEETGTKFGVTRERIRQIEAKSLEKMRDYL